MSFSSSDLIKRYASLDLYDDPRLGNFDDLTPFHTNSNEYLEYYTCREFNKKLIKKLNSLNKKHENLRKKLSLSNNSIDGLKSSISDFPKFKSVQSSRENFTDVSQFTDSLIQNTSLIDRLFAADSTFQIRKVGQDILENVDHLIQKKTNLTVSDQNSAILIEQLQEDNQRLKSLFEKIERELIKK